jgi:hypothetical protein
MQRARPSVEYTVVTESQVQWRDVNLSPKRFALTIKIFKIASHTRTYEEITAI